MPLLEEMLMIDPPPARCMDRTTDFMPSMVPVRFTSTTLRNFSTSCFTIGAKSRMPALLTRMLTAPKRASQSSTAATHSSSDVTSRWR